ncbi:hypothetical protein P4O66_012135 [Electrophorus voltai]|uniref:Uncharacterized protein n=1 Tax=Electrophorus voltai TaxID=2609070 RepID=A0AAD9DTQ6_9TELE|nr:hypothetical protein P4O66_012135 [Electrophorus voltai]
MNGNATTTQASASERECWICQGLPPDSLYPLTLPHQARKRAARASVWATLACTATFPLRVSAETLDRRMRTLGRHVARFMRTGIRGVGEMD